MKPTAILLALALVLSLSSCAHPYSLSSSSSVPPVTGGDQWEQTPSSSDRSTSCTVETTVDLSDCFQGVNGCAVVYSPSDQQLWFYQESLCRQQASPFSTFKIISALLGLEAGVVKNETSTMDYNGIQYANSAWNDNLTLAQAFSSSAVELVSRLMLVEEDSTQSIYGKTGTGSDGRAWLVGFSQKDGTRRYFAVYLDDRNDTPSVSGSTAKEIALRLDLWAL